MRSFFHSPLHAFLEAFLWVYKCINKFEQEIQIQCNDSNSLAASLQLKLLGKHFQKVLSVYLI